MYEHASSEDASCTTLHCESSRIASLIHTIVQLYCWYQWSSLNVCLGKFTFFFVQMGFYLCLSKYSYIYILVLLFFACVCVLFAWQHPSALITSAQTLTFCSKEERREDLKSHLSLLFNVCECVCLETCMNTCVQAMGVPA